MSTLGERRTGDVRWQFRPTWDETLLGPEGLQLQLWLREGRAQVVKDGGHRTVYRVDLPQRQFYLKHYRCRRWRDVLRHLVRASASRREWRKTLAVARRRLPTATPVAFGEQRHAGLVRDNYFVTEALPHTCSLDDFLDDVLPQLPPARRARTRRELTIALARLCADLHGGGVAQNDMHPGNVLVEWGPRQRSAPQPAPMRLYMIDLPGVRLGKPLSWRKSRASLAMLNGGLLWKSTRSDRWRFWCAYLAQRGDLRMAVRRGAAEVTHCTRKYARKVGRRRDKRPLRNNREFQNFRTRSGLACAVRAFAAQQLANLLADPERPIRDHRHAPAKISHSSLVVRARLEVGGRTCHVAYKRCRVKNWWKALLTPWRRSRALRSWVLGNALALRGIPTAQPLVACHRRRSRDSYLATLWIDGAQDLHLYGWQLAKRSPDDRRRRAAQCAESLGSLLGKLHYWHIAHRDLKAGNLAAVERPDCVETYLIDLDGMHRARRLSAAQRARNLARLAASLELHPWVTRSLQLRLLRAYLRQAQLPAAEWKPLWRQVERCSERLTHHKRRRGRVAG